MLPPRDPAQPLAPGAHGRVPDQAMTAGVSTVNHLSLALPAGFIRAGHPFFLVPRYIHTYVHCVRNTY